MKYRVSGATAHIDGGAVLTGLTPDQVRRRRHKLENLPGGRHKVLGTGVMFKRGEVVDVAAGNVDLKNPGWEGADAPPIIPTKLPELRSYATRLGLKVTGRVTIAKLKALIADAG